jgi:hypothetical protein
MRVATWNLGSLFAPKQAVRRRRRRRRHTERICVAGRDHQNHRPRRGGGPGVGPPPALDDLAAAAGGERHPAVTEPDGRGIRVGVLARRIPRDVEQIVDLPAGLGPVQVDDTRRTLTRFGRPAQGDPPTRRSRRPRRLGPPRVEAAYLSRAVRARLPTRSPRPVRGLCAAPPRRRRGGGGGELDAGGLEVGCGHARTRSAPPIGSGTTGIDSGASLTRSWRAT